MVRRRGDLPTRSLGRGPEGERPVLVFEQDGPLAVVPGLARPGLAAAVLPDRVLNPIEVLAAAVGDESHLAVEGDRAAPQFGQVFSSGGGGAANWPKAMVHFPSRQNISYHITMHIRQTEVAALEAIG